MSTDERTVVAFLQRSRRRRLAAAILTGAAVAVGVGMQCLALVWLGLASRATAIGLGLLALLAGAALGAARVRSDRARIALEIERRAPEFRNLLVTTAELHGFVEMPVRAAGPRSAASVSPGIMRLVTSRAAEQVARVDAASLFPLRRPALWLGGGLVLWAVLASAVPLRSAPVGPAGDPGSPAATPIVDLEPVIEAVDVTLTPPLHTGLEVRNLVDPSRLEVVEGTRISVEARAVAEALELATLAGSRELSPSADGLFRVDMVAVSDGFLSLEPRAGDRAGPRRLVGLLVAPDAAPLVRITEPGRDLFLPQPDVEIPLTATASDDFGISELRLTYTIVSGSGETFEFTEGELPGRPTRADDASWRIDAELSPAALGLSLGDMVVYRAVGRDNRPDAPEVVSDAFVVEIVGESAAISGGFALESDEEREALSQRMVIVKTERLLAQRGSMSPQEYAAEARRIAAEQRRVRAEFVFMMGGEIQDEVEEAEHEHDVAAGRLELAGRQEMYRAVQFMSQAATMLSDGNLEAALPLEESALEALQGALSRSRYILRAMAPRQSIDLSRRLTGAPGPPAAARAAEEPVIDPESAALRRLLAEVAAQVAAAGLDAGGDADGGAGGDAEGDADRGVDRAALNDLAEAVLRLDPASAGLQGVAANLTAATAPQADAAALLESALDVLRARLEASLPLAPTATDHDPALAGAFAEEMARRGQGR